MVAFGDVRRWRPEPLDEAEQQLKSRCERLLALADEFADMAIPESWTGPAADAAGARRTRLTDRMERLVAGTSAARTALMNAADAVIGLRHAVTEAVELASANGFALAEDGTVRDAAPPRAVPAGQVDEVQRERQRLRAELVDRVEQIIRRADDIDSDLATVLDRVANGDVGDGGATTLSAAAEAGATQVSLSITEPPAGKGTPGDNAGWWDSLSKTEQRWVIRQHPEWIGNRDGVPFAARDEANRARLVTEKARLQEEARRLRADLDDNVFGGLFTNADARLDQVEEKLEAIRAIERTLTRPGERQLVLFDTTPERAEAAIATGNVDTADHVAVFTPGLTSNVPDSMAKYDSAMDQLQHRATDELKRYGDGGSVATVTWIGYQAPQNTLGSYLGDDSVLFDDAARAGAEKLTPFLQGIDTARDADAHLTALGHSYGSTTTGFALQQNTGVDDAVFFGSPGIGTGRIEDLAVPDGHATYIEAKNDVVGDLGAFGIDPSHLDGMRHAESGEARHPEDGRVLAGVTGHSAYLDDGSTSQYNMSVIVGGMPDRVVQGENRGIGDIGSWPIPGTY
ncbi:alpha/beta hydrolase family protein [Prauserella shujinwangii]|uniref:Alpha/beta hydrolase family protein n=1 Tax=Prauserella shujinwangii TaxID=1453103 RepID=A0A2T0LV99_9PSEU|nr:alpha/beta hydrolase [Prauserella shujinwangii]PRX47755.1 alpha/beta hydrolase family protein [Prauserella shujinwangii]